MRNDGSKVARRRDEAESRAAVESRTNATPRYPFLDGLRGLTALYVVLHHAAAELDSEKVPWGVLKWMLPLRFGHYSVAVFIVLSGFCIALPIACDPNLAMRGGLTGYLKRRARRILPPYYAALAILVALMAAVPILNTAITHRWGFATPGLGVGTIVSHLLLSHDLSPAWKARIDPPMWSVAVEWRIYLIFPMLLVVWRRFGVGAMVLAAVCVGNLDKGLEIALGREVYPGPCSWYVVLFAMGAAAARAAVAPGRAWPWTAAAVVLLAAATYLIDRYTFLLRRNDHLFGLAIACSLVACARISREGGPLRIVLREVLESRIAVLLGSFSYSLYLVHYPILSIVHAPMLARGWSSGARLAVLLTAGTALALALSYAFHLVFERPTLVRPEPAAGSPPGRRVLRPKSALQTSPAR